MGNTIGSQSSQPSRAAIAPPPPQPGATGRAGSSGAAGRSQAPVSNDVGAINRKTRQGQAGLCQTDQQLTKAKTKLTTASTNAAKGTAKAQALGAYGLSFGGPAAGVRAAQTQVGAALPDNKAISYAGSGAMALTALVAPAVHGKAGKAAAPVYENQARFVKPDGTGAKNPDHALQAFKPFEKCLGVGNTAVHVGKAGMQVVANQAFGAGGDQVAGQVIDGITNALLLAPGYTAAVQTVENIMGAQSDLGNSLQEPINEGNVPVLRKTVGTTITHKTPIHDADGNRELGRVNIKTSDNQTLTMSVKIGPREEPFISVERRETPEPKTSLSNLAKSAGDYLRPELPGPATIGKMKGLVSTLVVTTGASIALKEGLEALNVPPEVSGPLSTVIVGGVNSLMLSKAFIPAFKNAANDFSLKDALPFNGPAEESNQRQVDDNERRNVHFAGLKETHMEEYAQTKSDMMAVLNIVASDKGISLPVSLEQDGSLKLDPSRLEGLAIGLESAPNPAAQPIAAAPAPAAAPAAPAAAPAPAPGPAPFAEAAALAAQSGFSDSESDGPDGDNNV